ncbi:MAG: glycosyltransferase family 2 protein [Gammaproteobacteria bacterium]|nr:glycosyltransferase family 2 protein [Gammaproteobacteria bacterium]
MWYDTLYQVLDKINTVILYGIGIPFFLQLIYMLLFWIPKKKFKKTEKKNRIAVVIPAHNEEDVIYDTVKELFDKQKYPKELFDVYVIADNCTDKTEELAMKAGATVFVHKDDNPKHHMVGYALEYGLKELLKIDASKHYDYMIRLDADNHVNDEFFSLMNDAYNSGAKIARPYESATNMTQSAFTKACGLYYIFDSRCSSRVRERLHLDAHVNGPGSLTDMDIIRRIGGYDTVTMCEDTEFNFKRMFEKIHPHFVEDAVVYEDLPSTFKDTLSRNKRLGKGNTNLLIRYTPKLFFYTFRNLNFSFLENWLTYIFIPICPILCLWLPGFYIYAYIYHFMGLGADFSTVFLGMTLNWLQFTTLIICLAIGLLFVFCGLLQATLMVLSDYKKMGAERRRDLVSGILLFPVFSIVYVITITIGIFSKPKWEKVGRNANYSKNKKNN